MKVQSVDAQETRNLRSHGFTPMELLIVVFVGSTMTAVSLPMVQCALNNILLSSAVQYATIASFDAASARNLGYG